ncbi:MAG: IS4 family transposase, partial [Romboutsia sp.]
IAKETKFVQRKSSITAEDFLALNVFHGGDICTSSLSQLASKYDLLFTTQISKQALDKRFNNYSVEFMKKVFSKVMICQNNT